MDRPADDRDRGPVAHAARAASRPETQPPRPRTMPPTGWDVRSRWAPGCHALLAVDTAQFQSIAEAASGAADDWTAGFDATLTAIVGAAALTAIVGAAAVVWGWV